MTFKEYVAMVNKTLEENPEYADLQTVYAKDAEGNHFEEVWVKGLSVGFFEDGDFMMNDPENDPEDNYSDEPNAICIN